MVRNQSENLHLRTRESISRKGTRDRRNHCLWRDTFRMRFDHLDFSILAGMPSRYPFSRSVLSRTPSIFPPAVRTRGGTLRRTPWHYRSSVLRNSTFSLYIIGALDTLDMIFAELSLGTGLTLPLTRLSLNESIRALSTLWGGEEGEESLRTGGALFGS